MLREIEMTSNLLNETQQNRAATLDHFLTLRKQIEKRQQLITTLQTEVQLIDEGIIQAIEISEALRDDLDRLMEEYGMIARAAIRTQINKSATLFVFSAPSINEAFQRWQYIRQYDRYRKKQARLIVETQKMLDERLYWLEEQKKDKENLLESEEMQAQLLADEIRTYDVLLADLKRDEKRLSGELQEKQSAHQKLSAAIERIIREEMARSRRENRNPDALNNPSSEKDEAIVSGAFEQNRGKLPWPVLNGVVTGYYGRQKHPTLENVTVDNNGIDIRTDQGANVRAVFEGEVVGTQYVPGYNYMLIVKHGNYYTVYSNLEEVIVQRGDIVKHKEIVGMVHTDLLTNTASLHFEVWQEKQRMNPLNWVSGK
ncbi:MAG: peptidoglycan DD-metalloendopeptidase family protein [Bacteroidetes bacterium]|nr:peptidoglycan DD-metalloendopeptidase family protein [Bacteroidota bacterium]